MSDKKVEKIIYFVRHGQSEDNIMPVFQSPNSPLTKQGESQADILAERISKLSFGKLISSPFKRAKQTAESISKISNKEVEYSNLFTESEKPAYVDGKSYEDAHADRLWREWEKSLYISGARVEDGENFDDILSRVDNALKFLESKTEDRIAVVSHSYFLRAIIARVMLGEHLSGDVFKKFQKNTNMENTGITVLRHRKGFEEGPTWRLWTYNDHSHLDI